jgi:hypothetical protein
MRQIRKHFDRGQQMPEPLVTAGDGITATGGWLCRNYQIVRDYQLGTKALKA